jgi:hypothetical protein
LHECAHSCLFFPWSECNNWNIFIFSRFFKHSYALSYMFDCYLLCSVCCRNITFLCYELAAMPVYVKVWLGYILEEYFKVASWFYLVHLFICMCCNNNPTIRQILIKLVTINVH